jgi:hypothetical protein
MPMRPCGGGEPLAKWWATGGGTGPPPVGPVHRTLGTGREPVLRRAAGLSRRGPVVRSKAILVDIE